MVSMFEIFGHLVLMNVEMGDMPSLPPRLLMGPCRNGGSDPLAP